MATCYALLHGYSGKEGKETPWPQGVYVLVSIFKQYINEPDNFREWIQIMREITDDVIEHGRKEPTLDWVIKGRLPWGNDI